MKRIKHGILLLGAGLALSWSRVALAAPLNCTISSTAVIFGNYLPTNTTPLSGTGTLTISCNKKNVSLIIALSIGQGSSYGTRYMAGGSPAAQLNYNLYTNAAHSILWGDGTGGSSTNSKVTGGANQALAVTVYGLIPDQQNISAGTYTDSITATVNY